MRACTCCCWRLHAHHACSGVYGACVILARGALCATACAAALRDCCSTVRVVGRLDETGIPRQGIPVAGVFALQLRVGGGPGRLVASAAVAPLVRLRRPTTRSSVLAITARACRPSARAKTRRSEALVL